MPLKRSLESGLFLGHFPLQAAQHRKITAYCQKKYLIDFKGLREMLRAIDRQQEKTREGNREELDGRRGRI
jgi:hypothetical protein